MTWKDELKAEQRGKFSLFCVGLFLGFN